MFVWAGAVFYPVYATGEELWGISPLRDQGLAGAVMMIEGSLVTIAALAWLFLRLAQEGEVRQELLERGLDPARRAARRPLRPRAGADRPALNSTPMRPTGVHHVDLVVSSIERSLPFYRDLLGPLGYHRISEVEGERGETIWYFGGTEVEVGLRQAQSGDGHDRYSVGLHHLAFEAYARGVVDERYEWLLSVGAEIESEPQEYAYEPGYYAVFFYDPDGLKLEIVHVPGLAA